MGQAVTEKKVNGTKETEIIRHKVTDVLADAMAKAIAKRVFDSVVTE